MVATVAVTDMEDVNMTGVAMTGALKPDMQPFLLLAHVTLAPAMQAS